MDAFTALPIGAPLLGGRVTVARLLGRGTMGIVYEVVHSVTQHRRALKVLTRSAEHEMVVRFLREASAAARIENPHIVEIFDAGTMVDGSYYLLMEFLDGLPLLDHIAAQGSQPVAQIVELLRQGCSALGAAHLAGIVHRDVKPANIIIVHRDGRPFFKLLDFGIALAPVSTELDQKLTQIGQLLGTPAYMAPEQFLDSGAVDGRADIYSLGVTAYTALAGRRPFRAATIGELAGLILRAEHEPLSSACPQLPAGLCSAIERAMHPLPAQRFPTAAAFGEALKEFETLDARFRTAPMTDGLVAARAAAVARAEPDTIPNVPSAEPAAVGFGAPPRPSNLPPRQQVILSLPPSAMPALTAPHQDPQPAPGAPPGGVGPAPKRDGNGNEGGR